MEKKLLLVEFGKRLKTLRKEKGLKQTDMADIMGMTDRQYQRYEYGMINVPATTLNFFADFFGVTTDYLLGREEKS
jgi:transcriptional regulator with XRE-family HTH domain